MALAFAAPAEKSKQDADLSTAESSYSGWNSGVGGGYGGGYGGGLGGGHGGYSGGYGGYGG